MGKRTQKKAPYIGSVRFFKHMILAVLALLIVIPNILFFASRGENRRLKAELTARQTEKAPEDAPPDTRNEDAGTDWAALLSAAGEEADEADEAPAYAALYPDLRVDNPPHRTPVYEHKTAYLTFDDGPSSCTDDILDILDRYGVKATFFVVGKSDEESIRRMKRIVEKGHTLGLHSYSHEYSDIYSSVEDYLADIHALYTLVKENVGVEARIIRFPGGSINGYNAQIWPELTVEMVRRGFVYFDWNVSSDDAVGGGAASVDAIVSHCMEKVDRLNRAVILMHDSSTKRSTVTALPRVIDGYLSAGFTFAALNEEVKPVVFNYPE